MPDPVDPVRRTLLDGSERRFLLSAGGLRRIREALKASNLQEILGRDIEAVGPVILWEGLQDKGLMTEQEFLDLLPADLPTMLDATMTLLDRSYPERKRKAEEAANPPPANPTSQ